MSAKNLANESIGVFGAARRQRFTTRLLRFAFALRAFLQGFVGETSLPHDRRAARQELINRSRRRDRCC